MLLAAPRGRPTIMTACRVALVFVALLLPPGLAGAAPEGKIVIAQGVDPTTLDPQWHEETPAYNVLLNVYDTLLFRDKDLKIIPWLAESWKLENHLALRGAIMPPGHFRGKDKVFADRNPVGSGPYKFVRWVKDEQIELEAHPGWWGGAPKIKTLVFRPIPEHAVRAAALQAGEIDVAVNIPPHLVQIIDKHPRLYVSKAPSVRTIFIPIYAYQYDTTNKPVGPVEGPTRDKRVRQALLAAVNVDEIIKTVLEGNAVRTATPLTPKHFGV